MSADERYEQLLAYIATHVPAPFTQDEAEDAVVFTGGSPGEVVVRLTTTSVIVEEYAVRWETPYAPAVRPRRVGMVKWRRLPETTLMTIVGQLIKGARDTRLARYRTCVSCGQRNPPEWMASRTLCQSCANRQTGAVH